MQLQPNISPIQPEDYSHTVEVWEASVRATHHFVSEADIQFFRPLVRDVLPKMEHLLCVRDEHNQVAGLMGIAENKVEMLFLHPDARGKGAGKQLLTYAVHQLGAVTLDVNEENDQAVGFYLHLGFEVIGRSELDSTGKPYPILHLHFGIPGKLVTLHRTKLDDLPDLLGLWNDGRVMKWVGFPNGLGYDLERMTTWLNQIQANPNRHHFVIHAPDISFCGETYYAADKIHRRAELDIKLIPEAQGKGIATDALKTLIDHILAQEPEIDAVWTEPSAVNHAARALYTRCGLQPQSRPPDLPEWESYWELRRT